MQIPVLENLARALSWFPASLQKTLGGVPPDEVSYAAAAPLREVPGGTPLSFCPASRSTDLLNISMVQIDQLPRPIHIDDDFNFYLYGTLKSTFPQPNATITVTVDCGSHCADYGVPPGQGDSFEVDFCEFSQIEQPLGGKRESPGCPPPEPGPGLISSVGYVWPMFIRAPGWYNFTFDATTATGERIYCLTAEVCLRWEREKDNEGYPKGPWSNCTWPR